MQPDKKQARNYFYFYAIVIYTLLAGYLTLHFIRYISSNDGFLYLSIADKYASGHFYEAINDYWSPLLSWVLALFALLKIDPIISMRLVEFLAGCFALIAFLKIIFAFNLSKGFQFIASLVAGLIITYFLVYETPDILFVGVVLWYIYFITKPGFLLNNRNAALIGFLGALLYFAKAIGFYLFLGHITFCFAYLFLKEKDLRIIITKGYAAAIVAFALISGIWIAALCFKYHHFTISDAGKYNSAMVGPKHISLQGLKTSFTHPINSGIYQLPDKYSLSYWERPQISTLAMQWSPFSSKAYFNFFLHLMWQNFLRLYYDVLFKLFFSLWVISVLLYYFIKKEHPLKGFNNLALIALIVLTVLPYTWIFVVSRYLLPAEILLFIAVVYNFNSIINSGAIIRTGLILIAGITTIFICRYWLINLKQYNESEHEYRFAYNDISRLRDLKLRGLLVATAPDKRTTLLSYYTRNPYLGQISEDSLREKNYYTLYKNKVKYIVDWGNNKDTLFTNFKPVFFDSSSHLKIFDITDYK